MGRMGKNCKIRYLLQQVAGSLQLISGMVACPLFAQPAMAQQNISGFAKDTQGQPLSFVSVTLHSDSTKTSSIKGYAVTDGNGAFNIKAEAKRGWWLVARCIGYADVKRCISSPADTVRITMREDSKTLSEVLVKGNYSGVKMHGDTITFDTDHFKTGTEDNVGDVLRRLPGVEVTEKGKVSYAGKGIDRLLVDGKNLFSQGEDGIVVNNMDAGLVKGAEILTDYKEKSIADSLSNRKLQALNIKTSGNWKVTGNIKAGGGIEDKYDEKSAIIYMNDKLSLTGIVSANNTGSAIFSIDDYLNNLTQADPRLGNRSYSTHLSKEESQMLYPSQNVYKNNSVLASLTANYQASPKLRIKGNVLFNSSWLNDKTEAEDLYLADSTKNSRLSSNEKDNHIFRASLWEEFKDGKAFEMDGATSLTVVKADERQKESNTAMGGVNALQKENFSKMAFSQKIATRHKTGSGVLFTNTMLTISSDKTDNNILTDSVLLKIPHLQQLGGIYPNAFKANKRERELSVMPEVGYTLNFARQYNLNFSMSYQYRHNQLEYLDIADECRQQEHNDKNEMAVSAFLKKSSGLLQFRVGSTLSRRHYSSDIADLNRWAWALSPKLSLSLEFKGLHSIDMSYSYDKKDMEQQHLSHIMMTNRYNNIIGASAVDKPYYSKQDLTLAYHVFDIRRKSFLTINGGMIRNDGIARPHITQNGITSTFTYHNDGKTTLIYGHANWTKGLMFIPVDAVIGLNYNRSTNTTMVNSIGDKVTSRTKGCTLTLRSTFKGAINGELSGGYKREDDKFVNAHITNKMDSYNMSATISYASKLWRCRAYLKYESADNMVFNNEIYDLGFSLEYRMKRLGIRLSGENLLNIKSKEWVSINTTQYYTSTYTYGTMPGNLMLGLTYRL